MKLRKKRDESRQKMYDTFDSFQFDREQTTFKMRTESAKLESKRHLGKEYTR